MSRCLSSAAVSVIALAVAVSSGAQPRFQPIPDTLLLGGSPLHVPLDGSDPTGEALTYTAVSSDPLVEAVVLTDNRSLRIRVANYGEMVFELFDGRARRVTNRIAELADTGFYDDVIFHRIINDFVIQGGDPTGTGTGGSGQRFNDQYHVDLQHNQTGLLSMAKSDDDTNDSQFFITEGAHRHLDFNHSIFGLLVEGEAVREAISNVATGAGDRPVTPVAMESARSFIDDQNAVLMLKAPEGATGAADVTVTVQNTIGTAWSQTFRVNVSPDTVNSPPFLEDIPRIATPVNTPTTFQLVARDVEGQPSFYLDQNTMASNGLRIPTIANENLIYTVDFNTGLVTITPTNGLSGTHFISVATAVDSSGVDYQVVPVDIGVTP